MATLSPLLAGELLGIDTQRIGSPNRGLPASGPIAYDPSSIRLKSGTYEQARDVALGWDVYILEQEWRDWITDPPWTQMLPSSASPASFTKNVS